MRRRALPGFLIIACLATLAEAGEVVIDGRKFRVAEGFVVEKVAGQPLVDRPIVADFDEAGRLYVADSSGSNDNVKKQEVDRPHRIVRLEDTDGDGKFDHSVVFADKMMFPEGAMWLDGSLYVAAPPSIWKLTDTDGDGVADRREEWFQGKTLTGCANDLHGPYAGLDGRIYWCKGAFASQSYERPGRKPFVTRAAHIFRARPDGTEIEPVMTGGMDNPVEVAFTPEGERIFTTTFLQQPGGGRRDGLIHALYGGVYGKDHSVIDDHPRTGPDLLAPLVHLGPAAPAGLMRAESKNAGTFGDLFTACFNLRKVTRHKLTADGAGLKASTEDFLATDDLDFHPTDVLEDADGSILVVDTGGWYKLCCPTSQLVKPDILGAIYRVRPVATLQIGDNRALGLNWSELKPDRLTELLLDPRPVVRKRAMAILSKLGKISLPAIERMIRTETAAEAKCLGIWVACRIDGNEARALVRLGLSDSNPSVRQVAAHAAGLWRDRQSTERLVEILQGDAPCIQRAAAEALGRIGLAEKAVPALLLAADTSDPALRHSATFALIEINNPQVTRAGLTSKSPLVRRAALMSLESMENRQLEPSPVIESLSSPVADLAEAAWWIAARHPEWGEAIVADSRLRRRLNDNDGDLFVRMASLARMPAIAGFLGELLSDPSRDRRPLIRTLNRSGVKDLPSSWIPGLVSVLASPDPDTVSDVLVSLKSLPIRREVARELVDGLRLAARRVDLPAEARLNALASIPGGPGIVEAEEFALLLDRLQPACPAAERALAAEILAKASLATAQQNELTKAVTSAGPLELTRLLDAFASAKELETGLKLVRALARSPALTSLQIEKLRPRLDPFGSLVQAEAETLYRAIDADSADRLSRLDSLVGNLTGGDVRRGQVVFNGSKAACVTCHQIGYVGGKLGPDLTRIGQVRSERDLLESIVFPSASFVRSYEPVVVATTAGRTFSGLLRQDSPSEVVVTISADHDEHIPRDQVEEIKPGTVSVMPAGLDKQLTPQELSDLIAFLKACR